MGSDVEEMMQTNAVTEDAAAHIGADTSALPSAAGRRNPVVPSVAVGPDRFVPRFTLQFPDRPLHYSINDVVHAVCG
jgi:hypothetical protein